MGPILGGRQGKGWREEGIEGWLRTPLNIAYAHENTDLSALECLPCAKHCPKHFLYNPSSDIRRNILDLSGVGVAVVPEVPQGLTPNPVQFSLQEAVFFSQAGSERRDSSLTWGWRDM